MQITFTDQKYKLEKYMERFRKRAVMDYDIKELKEKTTVIEIEKCQQLDQINLDFFFNYEIFPPNIMAGKGEWQTQKRAMKPGDIIIQQAYLPPVSFFSQKILFGVKINKIINEANRKGFSYETLEGHVEKGISIFTIEASEQNLIFKIHTFSKPGNFLTQLLGPLFSIPYQTYCTKAALKNVKRQIENQL